MAAPLAGYAAVHCTPRLLSPSCLPAPPAGQGFFCSLFLFQRQRDQHRVDTSRAHHSMLAGLPLSYSDVLLPVFWRAGPSQGGRPTLVIVVTPAGGTEAGRWSSVRSELWEIRKRF